ncbi:alternate-type signal peptide domain-containing protein [Rhodococcus sp. OK302]|uniref:alternate-type signal peptide domain-containing protein n=1 Tax=Rhodococcus sp. OK302 TaxID=1882769 RepID=UPI000B941707|nr:alternate-type signal peptide domain-containing protein [Rhodococcus sp. OK302]OYD66703.1 alternate signal-mediated exported protein [Rhodococcus sp. OK302]
MKKTTKGAIAAAFAALLLAGGAGTMAAWSASTTAGVGTTITAGSMAIEQVGTGTWEWADGSAFDPLTDRIVPGDVVSYTADYTFDLVGKNLKATLTPSLSGVTGDLVNLGQLSVAAAPGITTVFTAGLGQTASYTTEITFLPKVGEVDNTGQTKTASLAGGVVTLDQSF